MDTPYEKNAEHANEGDIMWHKMDVTTQLHFWVTYSSLHLPSLSKKHMLGFYDLLSFVSEDEWAIQQPQLDQRDRDSSSNTSIQSLGKWWNEKLWRVEKKRDLMVVLSVRYTSGVIKCTMSCATIIRTLICQANERKRKFE